MDRGKVPEADWSSGYYDLKFEVSEENKLSKNFTIPFGSNTALEKFYQKTYKNNQTLFLHF